MGNIKQISIKNRTYYFFNDVIDIKDFDSNLLKIDKTSDKNIGSYNIGYIAIKKNDDYENIHSVNPLCLMISEIIGHIEQNSGNKYLVFDSSDENKEVLKNYKKLSEGIKNKTRNINDSEYKYGKYFTKIRFGTDDDLPLNKPLNQYMLTIIVRSVLEDEGKFYPQVYLDECLYKL